MKKNSFFSKATIVAFIIGGFILNFYYTEAGNLTCQDVDGMSIFGYKFGEYIFIGSIANEFDSNSIANKFGWGNEFKSDSIMNKFGTFGSEFSPYSAFNKFASKPPIIINRDNKFVGYLTINDFKIPSINTYVAIACAKNSFKSSIKEHEHIVFKKIPPNSSGGYDYPNLEELMKSLCPLKSQYINGQCICNEGYVSDGTNCITYTHNCQRLYGIYSYSDKNGCYCKIGYEWNPSDTACVKSIIYPQNSQKINNVCVCNEGYVMRDNECTTYTEDCIRHFGPNVYGVKGNAGIVRATVKRDTNGKFLTQPV